LWVVLGGLILAAAPALGQPDRQRPTPVALALVQGIDPDVFRADLRALSGFGDRAFGTARNRRAMRWIRRELTRAGYRVAVHRFEARGRIGRTVYATKVGAVRPDRALIVSAHFDGRGRGTATDDDASGVALVLQAARMFAPEWVRTDISVRFVLWHGEEVDRAGSRAYVRDRQRLQGRGRASRASREPRWIGVIQHDMILFDHGLPARRRQTRNADIDIEFRRGSARARSSRALARALARGNRWFAERYPARTGGRMANTDSVSFSGATAAISVRENRRLSEIGRGSNPHWHRPTDRLGAYRPADLAFGLDAVRTSVGTVAQLAGASVDTTRLVDPVVQLADRTLDALRSIGERLVRLWDQRDA
jgi:hypothetical protein